MLFARWICQWRSAGTAGVCSTRLAVIIMTGWLCLVWPLAVWGQFAEKPPSVAPDYLSEPRVWKDNSSTFSVLARLRGFEDGKAILERSDNSRIARVPFETFCREDLLFLLEIYQVQLEQGAVPSWPAPSIPEETDLIRGGTSAPAPSRSTPDATPRQESDRATERVVLPELDPPPQIPENGTTRPQMVDANGFFPERPVERDQTPAAARLLPDRTETTDSPTQSATLPQRREESLSPKWDVEESGLSADPTALTSGSSSPTNRVPVPDHSPFDMLAEERQAVESEAAFSSADVVKEEATTQQPQLASDPGDTELAVPDFSIPTEKVPTNPVASGGAFRPSGGRFQPNVDEQAAVIAAQIALPGGGDFAGGDSGATPVEKATGPDLEAKNSGSEPDSEVGEVAEERPETIGDSPASGLLETRSAGLSDSDLRARLTPTLALEWDDRYGLTNSLDPTLPMLRTCFQIEGDVARDVFRVTITEFSGLSGDNDSSLAPERIPPGKTDLFRNWKGVVPRAVGSSDFIAETYARFQPAEPLPDFINPISGQMTVDVASVYREFTLPALEGALNEDALADFKDLGIDLRIRNPDARSVVIEFAGNHSLVGTVELIGDSQANELAQRSSTSRATWIQFNTLNSVDEETYMRMRVVVDSRSISVPLQSERMPLPPMPE